MNKDHRASRREDEIGRSGKVAPVEPVPVAERVDEASHGHFGTGISALHGPHGPAADLTRVRHLAEIDLEAGVRLYVIHDFVVSGNDVIESLSPIARMKPTPFVEIRHQNLLDVQNVEPIADARVLRQTRCHCDSLRQGDEEWMKPIIKILLAPGDHGAARSSRDVHHSVTYLKIALPCSRGVGCRVAIVLD